MIKFNSVTAAVAATLATLTLFQTTTADAKTVVMQSGSPALAAASTYSWAPTNSATVDPASMAVANEITARRLQTAIETALAGRGYRKATGPAAGDLAVSFHVAVSQQRGAAVADPGVRFCGWRGCLRTAPIVTQYNYTQGNLVIDLVSRRTGELVWRAASEQRIEPGDLSQAQLNALLAKMMKSLSAT
jgi:hypothetical protein